MADHDLDDRSFLTRLDPKEMLRLTCEFPDQCRRALDISRAVEMPQIGFTPDLAVLTGLGGSAAGGDFVRALFDDGAGVPFIVNRDYHLPRWVTLRSFVFCASYSGNTEETLSAFEDAKRSGAKVAAVTSRGKLAELSRAEGYPVFQIPGGQPPRTALGYMLVPVIVACEKLGLLKEQDYESAFRLLDQCVQGWGPDVPFSQNPAKKLAQELHGTVPILYGLGLWQSLVANRWKGQINENSKNMAFANAFPELNHNEILGWVKAHEQGVQKWSVVVLEDGTESSKMKA
ncbi:MAG TPA: bifunctional phosphoglucose/phosphomannose isomerase, partial [Fimbriimonadaceae bacterium]|nr:bifunctional phosphoglucose/phosphomannose isomerase [Fimbriimonadaceae bacterium]